MTWTMTNLMIEIIAGIVGAHTVAMAAREYSFGALGHSMVGAIGGCVSSYFLNALSAMVVNGSEALNEPRLLDQIVAHSLTAAATGGILMLIVGFVKPAIFATTDERPEVCPLPRACNWPIVFTRPALRLTKLTMLYFTRSHS